MGYATTPTSLDPHFHFFAPNQMVHKHVFEALGWQDEQQRLTPALATSWRTIDSNLWEFVLRRDVKFHDGGSFSAEDVVFSLERAPAVPRSPSSYGAFTKAITKIEIVDPHTIHIHTANAYPLLPIELANIAIVSRRVGANAQTVDYDTGQAMAGTGPYHFKGGTIGSTLRYEAFSDYWGGAPHVSPHFDCGLRVTE